MPVLNQRFDQILGPWCQATQTGTVTGTGAPPITVGNAWSPMYSHTGDAQFVEPATAIAAGQQTLDGMNRLVFRASAEALTVAGWTMTVTFTRTSSTSNTIYLVNIDTVSLTDGPGPFVTEIDRPMSANFMRNDTGPVSATDTLNYRVQVDPNESVTDAPVWFSMMLVPSNTSGLGTNRGQQLTGF